MAKQKQSFEGLKQYIPEGSFEALMQPITQFKVQLTVSRKRQSILGDYRHAHGHLGHRISVNGNLNKYSFLVTLLHELAHLFTFEKYRGKVKSHGQEWKNEFAGILKDFIQLDIFPEDVKQTLMKSLKNPAASSCSDVLLLRVLRNYDDNPHQLILVEELQKNELFMAHKRLFKMGEKIRTRFKCLEIDTGKWYLFSPVYEVKKVEAPK